MSGLMHKVKDALSGDKHTDDSAATSHGTTDSTHGSNPTHGGLGHSSTSGTTDTSGYGAHPGPNTSGLAADRDRDLSSGLGHSDHSTGTHGTHGTTTTSDYDRTTGGSGMTGSNTTGSGYGSGTAGPHSSNLANKADPRVDSDLDGRGTHGSSGYDRTTGGSGMTGSGLTGSNTTGSGYGSSDYDRTTGGSGMTGSGMTGSGMTGSGMTGSGMTGSGMTGTGTTGSGMTGTGTTGSGMTGSGLTGRDTTSSGYGSSTTGPHSSGMANKADPRVDSDRDGRRGVEVGSGGTGSGLTGSSTTGHHGQHGGLTGKADDIVHGGDHHTETANRLDPHVAGGRGPIEHATVGDASSGLGGSTSSTDATRGYGSSSGMTSGPHSSSMANKADPRVDSDRDGRRGVETGSGTSGGYGSSSTDATRGYGSSTDATRGYDSTTSGPHSSSMANKADPRVDSDRDGRRGLETGSGTSGGYGSSAGVGGTSGGYGSSTDATRGYGSSTDATRGYDSTTSGPHSSSMANKADPRVDSDRDGRRGLETGSGTSGGYGTSSGVGGTTSGYGSSTDATRGYGSSTGGNNYNDTTSSTGTGSADASGPHKSGMMNKLDPRVDSDNDGSRMR
ncbi:MAG: hypothetical protein LQ345_001265 [Seirophora villosa]|nr:MAG: hypothetical protein LQ345_001265 [Seirophora villosa]